jgi:tetratricopeptide (TPR) repeat protein
VRSGVRIIILVIAAVALPSSARAQASYSEANAAYQSGQWSAAAAGYEALVGAGIVHPHLYYNLGNAYFRCATEKSAQRCRGGLGSAIFNYERALRLDPNLEPARDNLILARETVASRWADRLEGAESDPLWLRITTFFTVGQLALIFLLCNVLLFGGLTSSRFLATGFTRTAVTVTNGFSAAALISVSVLLAGHIYFLELVDVGIVLPDQLQMREATDDKSAERADIHAGLRVEVIDREPGWLRIELANGHEGWVPDDAIGEL